MVKMTREQLRSMAKKISKKPELLRVALEDAAQQGFAQGVVSGSHEMENMYLAASEQALKLPFFNWGDKRIAYFKKKAHELLTAVHKPKVKIQQELYTPIDLAMLTKLQEMEDVINDMIGYEGLAMDFEVHKNLLSMRLAINDILQYSSEKLGEAVVSDAVSI